MEGKEDVERTGSEGIDRDRSLDPRGSGWGRADDVRPDRRDYVTPATVDPRLTKEGPDAEGVVWVRVILRAAHGPTVEISARVSEVSEVL